MNGTAGVSTSRDRRLVLLVVALVVGGVSLTAQRPSEAIVLDVSGSATGYLSNVSLFGGPATQRGPAGTPGCDPTRPAPGPNSNTSEGCSPTVTLPSGGSATPLTANDPDGARAVYGPAVLFGGQWPDPEPVGPPSGPISVSTQGTTGATGSVTSSVSIALAPPNSTWTVPGSTTVESWPGGVGPGPVVADAVHSTCRATDTGASGSTRITNGIVVTSTDAEGAPATTQPVPTEPPANYGPIHGTINNVGDSFDITYNEQILSPDGLTITVNAVHMKLLGPTAVGDLYIGQSKCAVTGIGLPTTTTTSTSTSTSTTSSTTTTSTTTTTTVPPAPRKAVADFDGDRDTDRSVFRSGAWYAEGQAAGFFGVEGDVPVPADYDGDGDADRAVYRGGGWYIDGQPTVWLGTVDDVPVPADYDGDGDADRAVFRPSVGAWYIDGQPTVFLGGAGDVPVPGDYDGDGDTEAAVWRPPSGGWHVSGQATQWLGLDGDVPVPGDYDGNGTTDRAVWRPGSGGWYVTGQATQWLGLEGDVPVPGDYDANGTADRAAWRPGSGGWHVDGQATAYLGVAGDRPLPLPAAIHEALS